MPQAKQVIDAALKKIEAMQAFNREDWLGAKTTCLTGGDCADLESFINTVFCADWACYAADVDRASYERMKNVISLYPAGFTAYMAALNGTPYPVGYTGAYPVSEDVFHTLETAPQTITNRSFMLPQAGSRYFYIFNVSIIPPLYKTTLSKTMVENFAADIKRLQAEGLCGVAVSDNGARFLQKFGMTSKGFMTHDGDPERVYSWRKI